MSRDKLSTSVWLLQGLFKSTSGILELTQDRLVFKSAGETVFDTPRESLTDVSFPWYYFGAGVVLSIDSKRYRFSFVEPGENGDLVSGREAGKSWKLRLLTL
ncbi:hypothetical protein [Armatimonas sp.]|uniref:hypothetical protein n=1 Tax=Armatimonas sp. TaxID=1872638 RepID=UPI00286B5CA5|nr:hypothetical protein [Armatimonas sp.]